MRPEDKVYKAFFKSKKQKLYFNQIKELSKLSDSSLSNTLKELTKQRILKKKVTKACTFYEIKDKKIFALEFSKIAHHKFNKLNLGVKSPLNRLLEEIDERIECIILFGSASRKQEREDSDIDIAVISNRKIRNITEIKQKVESLSNYPLQFFNFSTKDLYLLEDHVLIQVLTTGLPIKGEQLFYEVLLNERGYLFSE